MTKFITFLLIFLSLFTLPAQAVGLYQPYFIGSGTYYGAYRRIAYNGNIDWYFSNLALLNGSFTNGELVTYLNLYISRLDRRTQTIQNVNSDLVTLSAPDSHDSYASTFLSLVKKYIDQSNDLNWLINNQTRLKLIADFNLVNQFKSNNLISVFQAPHPNNIGYLMDNIENYKGLKDLHELLKRVEYNNTKYLNASNRVLTGIQGLRDPNLGVYKPCDVCFVTQKFYPDVTSNMLLQVYNIPNVNYNEINSWIESKFSTLPFTKYDTFPWLMVAQYYKTRNDQDRLSFYLTMVDTNFTPYGSFYPVHDWAIRNSL